MFTTSRASLAGTFCLLMLALRGKLLQELVAARTMDLGERESIETSGNLMLSSTHGGRE